MERKQYFKEYNAVRAEFNRIEGIKILKIWGNEDLVLEDIYATIELKDGNTLGFHSLGQKDFKNTSSISLSHINNWYFHETGCFDSSIWSGSSLDVGEISEYEDIRRLNLRNIMDVINNFDTLNRIIKKISIYPGFDTLLKNRGYVYIQKYDDNLKLEHKEFKWADCK